MRIFARNVRKVLELTTGFAYLKHNLNFLQVSMELRLSQLFKIQVSFKTNKKIKWKINLSLK